MTTLVVSAYDALLDVPRAATRYYLSDGDPSSDAEVGTMSLCAAIDATALINGIVNGAPDGRQYDVDAVTGVSIDADGTITHVVLTDASDNPLLSTEVSVQTPVVIGQSVNVNGFTHRVGGLVSV